MAFDKKALNLKCRRHLLECEKCFKVLTSRDGTFQVYLFIFMTVITLFASKMSLYSSLHANRVQAENNVILMLS